MLVLFDQGAPKGVAPSLKGHTVLTARERGWDQLTNGALLEAAEGAAFDVLFTTDQRIRYQQNLTGRKLAIILLPSNQVPIVESLLSRIDNTLEAFQPGDYVEL